MLSQKNFTAGIISLVSSFLLFETISRILVYYSLEEYARYTWWGGIITAAFVYILLEKLHTRKQFVLLITIGVITLLINVFHFYLINQRIIYFNDAMAQKNPQLCQKLLHETNALSGDKGEFSKKYCYFKLATDTNDVSLCKYAPTLGGYEPAKYNCYIKIAINTRNKSLCETLSDKKDREVCYFFIAKEINDSQLCDNISADYELKKECEDLFN